MLPRTRTRAAAVAVAAPHDWTLSVSRTCEDVHWSMKATKHVD